MERGAIWKREESSGNGARVRRLAVLGEWGKRWYLPRAWAGYWSRG